MIVAETGSFRQAARRVGLTQSAISRRIQRVEDLLGVSMFERRPSGVRVTPAGASFISMSRSIFKDLISAMETAQSAGVAEGGQLKIGVIASLSQGPLRSLIDRFLLSHSTVDLFIAEADRNDLLMELSHRRLDAVVAAGKPEPEIGDGILLAYENIFLAIPADHQWAARQRIHWDEVRDATFVVSATEPGPEIHDYISRRVSDFGRTANVRRHRLGREGIMVLVGLGVGFSLVADHWRGVTYPNVAFVPIGDENETVPFSLTWRPENDNPALRRFISLARIEARRNGVLS